MESLTPELSPFGIRTMLVEPGFFRTELLTPESTSYAPTRAKLVRTLVDGGECLADVVG
jgi:NAD(P)-dependent dehydrogenase (short-subunit alcohol dehydrogenase family)